MREFEDSETYKKIREHRKYCSKWGKEFCLECFGGGLTRVVKDWEKELREN